MRVKRREWLVQQHDLRFDGERPGQRDALLLAAGELVGVAARQLGQPDHVEQIGHSLAARRAGEPEGDVRLRR